MPNQRPRHAIGLCDFRLPRVGAGTEPEPQEQPKVPAVPAIQHVTPTTPSTDGSARGNHPLQRLDNGKLSADFNNSTHDDVFAAPGTSRFAFESQRCQSFAAPQSAVPDGQKGSDENHQSLLERTRIHI